MALNTLSLGSAIRITSHFRDVQGNDRDPTNITLKYTINQGPVQQLVYPAGVTKDAIGKYHADVTLDTVGKWLFRWEGNGGITAAAETKVNVVDPMVQ